nr:endogenous retrovirus group K member 19 Rec protein-like isoform X2 [Macaca fascicularis]
MSYTSAQKTELEAVIEAKINSQSGYHQDISNLITSQMPRERLQEDPKDPPVAAMSRLTLRRTPTVTSNTRRTQSPTWGQIKKMSQMAEENLRKAGQPVTMNNVMVAMIAVITTASADVDPDSCEK